MNRGAWWVTVYGVTKEKRSSLFQSAGGAETRCERAAAGGLQGLGVKIQEEKEIFQGEGG